MWAVDTGHENILHFVVGRRERECQWFASQDTGVANDWSRTRVFWSALDSVLSASFCLYKLAVGRLSSNLFSLTQKSLKKNLKKIFKKNKDEDQK